MELWDKRATGQSLCRVPPGARSCSSYLVVTGDCCVEGAMHVQNTSLRGVLLLHGEKHTASRFIIQQPETPVPSQNQKAPIDYFSPMKREEYNKHRARGASSKTIPTINEWRRKEPSVLVRKGDGVGANSGRPVTDCRYDSEILSVIIRQYRGSEGCYIVPTCPPLSHSLSFSPVFVSLFSLFLCSNCIGHFSFAFLENYFGLSFRSIVRTGSFYSQSLSPSCQVALSPDRQPRYITYTHQQLQ